MSFARDCTGCVHNEPSTLNTWCLKYHRTTPLSLVAKEHDPGRCYEDKRKDEPQEEQP